MQFPGKNKIKHFIAFSYLFSLNSNLDSSNGQDDVLQPSSSSSPPQTSPSSSPPQELNPPPASQSAADTPKDDPGEREKHFKRVGKMAYNTTLGVIAISVTVLMSIPHQIEAEQLNIYACTAAFACLSLLAGVGIIYFSIVNPVGERLAWVQNKVMVLYGFLLVFAVFFRMAAMFPPVQFLFVLLAVVIVLGLMILVLYLGWLKEKKIN